MRRVLLLALVSCGAPQTRVVSIVSEMKLTDAQKAKCPSLPSKVDQVKAQLIVEGLESTPCPLTVTVATDTLAVAGDCKGIPIGGKPLFTLQWYTLSPTVGKQVVLAESLGRAPLEAPEESTVDVDFDPAMNANLTPRTAAGATETAQTKDKFNCDRTGTNVCDSNNAAPPSTGNDVDTCSNLQELCAGTLFMSSVDHCN